MNLTDRAVHVMSEVINKAIELSRSGKDTCDELNNGRMQQRLDEAFDLIEHSPFVDRKELSEWYTKAVDESLQKMRERIQQLKEKENQCSR